MARIRMYEPYGYTENNGYVGKVTQLDNELATNRKNDGREFASVEYNETLTAFIFRNVKGDVVGQANMSDIIPKDLVKDARYDSVSKKILITFANDQLVEIDLDDVIDVAEAGDGLILSTDKFAIKLHDECEHFLTVSMDGLKLSGVQDAIDFERDRALAAEDVLDKKIDAETKRAKDTEKTIKSLLDNEIKDREDEDNRVLDDVLDRIWSNKEHDSGNTGHFETEYLDPNGSIAELWNGERTIGLQYYNNSADLLSSIIVNSDNADGVCVSLSSINNVSSNGTRLVMNPKGLYYTTNKANNEFNVNDEVLTKATELAIKREINDVKLELEDEISASNQAITTLVNTKYSELNAKINALDEKINALDSKMERLYTLNSTIVSINNSLNSLNSSVSSLNSNLNSLSSRVSRIEGEIG